MSLSDIALDFLQKLFSFDKAHPLLFTQFYFWAFFAIVFAIFRLLRPLEIVVIQSSSVFAKRAKV